MVHDQDNTAQNFDDGLSNPDIAPVPVQQRNWKAISFFALWVGMAVNIPSYMIAASLIDGGMSWQQAMWTVLLGNLIVFVPMSLSGHAGTKYGIPFPVFARASFGIKGAHIPSFLRAIVACGWFGIQTWIGGAAFYTIALIIWPGLADAPTMMPEWVGVSLSQFACFMLFWAMNIWLIWKGINSIRILRSVSLNTWQHPSCYFAAWHCWPGHTRAPTVSGPCCRPAPNLKLLRNSGISSGPA
jgi:NCS1 family nucleobase:cation symporter-1